MSNNKVCRVCLKLPAVQHYIFENGTIAMMWESVTNKPLVPNIEISSIICTVCLLTLKTTFRFLQKVKESEEKLLEEAKHAPEIQLYEEIPEHKDVVNIGATTCLVCGGNFGFFYEENSLNRHTRQHFYERQVCDICGKSFYNVKDLRNHLRTARNHQDKKMYQCKECSATFLFKTFYDVHRKLVCIYEEDEDLNEGITIKEEIIEDGIAKECKTLNKKTKRKRTNKLKFCVTCSKNVPSGHSHTKRQCPVCQRLISIRNYRKHKLIHDSDKQVCHLCGKLYANECGLNDHINRQHENRKKIFKCEDCDRVFHDKMRIKTHRQKEHVKGFSHYCETCGKGFYSSVYLNKHVKMSHLKLKKHVCIHCKRAFGTRYTLRTHLRQHTNELPFRCEECGDGFKHNVSLKTHLKSKHNIIEKIMCHCKECGKGFACEAGLNSHMRLHK